MEAAANGDEDAIEFLNQYGDEEDDEFEHDSDCNCAGSDNEDEDYGDEEMEDGGADEDVLFDLSCLITLLKYCRSITMMRRTTPLPMKRPCRV